MRIGMVTACYKPVINGVTRMISLYKQCLEASDHEVTVFTLGDPDPAGDEPGVVRSPAIPLGSSGYYFSIRYSRAAQELLSHMDIIHCHHLLMSAELAHRYGRCPIVYTNHTRYDLYSGSVIPIPQPAADALMRQIWPDYTDLTDVVITPSESVRQVMLEFGVTQPIEVIENGVELLPFRLPARPKNKTDLGISESSIVLIYVGRLSSQKNLANLLEQFAIAQDLVPELDLVLLGGGPLSTVLRRQAQELQLADRIHLVGPVDYGQVANYLAAADIFVTASVTEVHPLTVIEAMAAGLPIVAVSSPGIVDTVESGVSGLLTSHADGGLAAAITGLALNEERRYQMGHAARLASQRFDINNTVSRTVDLYERLRTTRPDLSRKREHGRWIGRRERLKPVVEQLDRLLRSAEKLGTGPLKQRDGDALSLKERRHGNTS
jgi:glycosyltransferase involved in cell wall biosynthesis